MQPDIALFGEKDWQQLAVIRRMARDLDLMRLHVDAIIGIPTVREADGLAMSSRNAYLSSEDRAAAAALLAAMRAAIAELAQGRTVDQALDQLHRQLLDAGFSAVDYAVVADVNSHAPLAGVLDSQIERPARLLVAATIGKTRLIDNMAACPAAI